MSKKYVDLDEILFTLPKSAQKIIHNWPITDVAPVKRGEWEDIHRQGLDGVFHYYRSCSLCGYERKDCDSDEDTPYCPNCGAEMEKGE